jgi:transcriptional regulatory protein RtcR
MRDLSASVARMATLARRGEIGEADVEDEIAVLRHAWGLPDADEAAPVAGAAPDPLRTPRADAALGERAAAFDLFDRAQLELVLAACDRMPTQAAAGRALFAVSRLRHQHTNDHQRLRGILARFGLKWSEMRRK